MAAVVLAITAGSGNAVPQPVPTEFPACQKFYHSACSEAIGKWLPRMLDWYDFPFFDLKAAGVPFTDAFIYEGHKPKWSVKPYAEWTAVWPHDGTFFVYGSAGPPKGAVVYDYGRQIAFYSQGCCSWIEIVVAAGVPAPPKKVVSRNLSGLHTLRGVALGQTVSEVMRLYRRAPITIAKGHHEIRRLSYLHEFDSNCGQSQNFIFKNNRLIYIALIDSC